MKDPLLPTEAEGRNHSKKENIEGRKIIDRTKGGEKDSGVRRVSSSAEFYGNKASRGGIPGNNQRADQIVYLGRRRGDPSNRTFKGGLGEKSNATKVCFPSLMGLS